MVQESYTCRIRIVYDCTRLVHDASAMMVKATVNGEGEGGSAGEDDCEIEGKVEGEA